MIPTRPEGDIIYRKVGRRYVPVGNTELVHYYANGFYLVHVNGGVTKRWPTVEPDNAPVLAAMKLAEQDLCDLIRSESEARPRARDLTAKEKQAVAAMQKILGADGFPSMVIESASEIARNVVRKVMESANQPCTDCGGTGCPYCGPEQDYHTMCCKCGTCGGTGKSPRSANGKGE